ncbi:MAG: leucine-rich repeat protein, partial [Clostridia bacterium]|nr:leucine-rich repeat protein [Clostridia bacterium]
MRMVKKSLAFFLAVLMLVVSVPVSVLPVLATSTELPTITVGTPVTVQPRAYEPEAVLFTPDETAVYTFYSISQVDPYGYIYNNETDEYVWDDYDRGPDWNFAATTKLEAGVTYRLETYTYQDEQPFEVAIRKFDCVSSVEFNTAYIQKGENVYNEGAEVGGEEVRWDRYEYSTSFVVTMADGQTVTGSGNAFTAPDDFEYGIYYRDDQGYGNEWTGGTYQSTGWVENVVSNTFTVEMVESLVQSVVADPVTRILNYSGHGWTSSDSLYDEETNECIGNTDEYFRYDIHSSNIVVTMCDGQEFQSDGGGFEWNGMWCDFSVSDPQNYENQWLETGEYTIHAELLGYEFTYTVELIETPVDSIVIPTQQKIKNFAGYHGEYRRDEIEYDEETGEWSYTPEYFAYGTYFYDYTVVMKDGTTYGPDDQIVYNGEIYGIEREADGQSYENQWTVGNTYSVPVSLLGYTTTYDIEIIESPVASVVVEPIQWIEKSQGGMTSDSLYDENGDYIGESDPYYSYLTSPQFYTVTMKDGSVYTPEDGGILWEDREYYLSSNNPQRHDNPWTPGNTYTVTGTVLGFEFTYTVEILESPIESVEVETHQVIENYDGYVIHDIYYDEETGEEIPSEEYFMYYISPEKWTITLKDGTIYEDELVEWGGAYYGFSAVDPQNSDNQWTVGNSYTIEADILGFPFTYQVEVIPTPVESIEVSSVQLIAGIDGDWRTDSLYSEVTGDYIGESDEYYRYSVFPNRYVVTMKDGSVFENDMVEWNDGWYNVSTNDDQSYDNQWTVGNTYEATVSVLGYSVPLSVEILDTPVVSIEFDSPVALIENEDGCMTFDEEWDEDLGEWVTSPEYFRYDYMPMKYTVTLVDGRKFTEEDGSIYWDGSYYSIFWGESGQSYETPWIAGNTYAMTGSVMGYEFEYEVYVAGKETADGFEYMNVGGELIILDYTGEDEIVAVPEFIGDFPVTRIASLGSSDAVTKVDIPDTVFILADSVFSDLPSLQSVIIGAMVSNLNGDMFAYCPELATVVVSDGNDFFCAEDGVIYDRSMERVIFCLRTKAGEYVMPETVGVIDPMAFMECTELTSVEISPNVTEIVYYTFAGCTSLADVQLPEALATIGESAFSETALESVELPDSLELMEPFAFYDCDSLASVGIGSGLTGISKETFYDCDALTALTVPDTIEVIGANAFIDCDALATLDLGDGVSQISDYAFAYCEKLGSVVLPDSLIAMGEGAFNGCEGLKSVSIGAGLETLYYGVFADTGLTSITIPSNIVNIETAFVNCDALTTVTIPDTVEWLCGSFADCDALTTVTIGKNAMIIPDSFVSCNRLTAINISQENPNSLSVDGVMFDKEKAVLMAYPAGKTATSYTVPSEVVEICYNAFTDAKNLKEVVFPNTLTGIGGSAFSGCSDLATAAIPASVQYIHNDAFLGTALTSVTLNNNIAEINPYTFSGTKLKSIKVPESVTMIMYGAFANCESLADIQLPKTLMSVDSSAFDNTAWYNAQANGPTYLSHIAYNYKGDMPEDTTIDIQDGITTTANAAFSWQQNLTAVTFPMTMKKVAYDSFSGTSVRQIDLPYGMETVGDAFEWCANLERVSIPETVTEIDEWAFWGSNPTIYCVEDSYAYEYAMNNGFETELITPLKITDPLEDVTVLSGETAKVTLGVEGEGLTYEWYYKNAGDSEFSLTTSFTGKSYSISMNADRAGRQVYCVVTDEDGVSVRSNVATLNMKTPLKITKQPASVSVANGKTAKVSFTATGDGLTYKWYFKDAGSSKFTLTTSFTGTSYSVPMTAARSGRQVYCVITDKYGDTVKTNTATLKMLVDISTCSVKLSATSYTYNGAVKTPTVTVKNASGTTLKKDTHYTVTYASGRKNAGTYKVTVTMKGGYTGTKTLTFKINPIDVSKCTMKLSTTAYTYNGAVKTPTVTVKNASGTTLTKNTHYTVTYASGRKNAGTYKVTVKMMGNYTGTKVLTFKINPINISKCKVSLSATSYTYNGAVKTPTVTVKNASGTKLTNKTHYTIAYASGRKNVGTYKVTVKMMGNYTGTKVLTYTIKPKAASINTLTAKSKALSVKLNRQLTQSTGYQIQYSTSKSFSGAKTKTITSYKTSTTTLTGLKA